MEDIKKIQEFFSKPVKENSRRSPDFILTDPAEIKYTESFGSGIKAPGVLHHANEGAFLGAEGAYIIVLPGGTFYVDEDKEEAIRIYPLKDQSRELQLALDYTPFSPKFETWKSWIKEPKTLGETDVNEELSLEQKKVERFLKAIAKEFDYSIQDAANFVKSTISQMGLKESLEEAYIVTYAKNKGEKPASAAYKLRGSALAFMRDLEKDGYTTMLTQRPVDGVDESIDEYGTGIYYKGEETKDKEELPKKSFLSILKDIKNLALKMAKDNAKEASQFIKADKIQDVSPMADIAKVEQSLVGLDEGLKDIVNKITTTSGLASALSGFGFLGSYLDQLELKYYQWYYSTIQKMADFEIFELLKQKYGVEEKISTWEQKMLMYAFFVFFTIFVVAIGAKLVIKAKDKFIKEEEEGYSKFLKTDDNPEGKTKGLDTKTFNKILMNVIKDLDESKPGLWANIHAKRKRGEKPSHGNSKAHKDAVKAGERINKEK